MTTHRELAGLWLRFQTGAWGSHLLLATMEAGNFLAAALSSHRATSSLCVVYRY